MCTWVDVCGYVHAYMYVCRVVCICVCMHVYELCVYISVCMCVCRSMCMCIYACEVGCGCVCTLVCVCVRVGLGVDVCLCALARGFGCGCAWVHTHTGKGILLGGGAPAVGTESRPHRSVQTPRSPGGAGGQSRAGDAWVGVADVCSRNPLTRPRMGRRGCAGAGGHPTPGLRCASLACLMLSPMPTCGPARSAAHGEVPAQPPAPGR